MILRVLLLWLLSATLACAQVPMTGAGLGAPGGGGGGYTGPGDVVTNAISFYSCTRGYNAAYATGLNKACNLRRASDNGTSDLNILSNGNFNVAGANSFAGVDATCQGSTTGSSTTIAFTSCSSTPNASDTVTGVGITQPEYIVSCGTFAGGAGSCTLSVAQNIAVAETVTMQVALFVTEMYDQAGAEPVTQSTAGNQPQWLPNCINSKPCMIDVPVGSEAGSLLTGTIAALSQPVFYSAVFETTNTVNYAAVVADDANSGDHLNLQNSATDVNTMQLQGGPPQVKFTANSNSWHAVQGVINVASTIANVDGTEYTGTTGSAPGDTKRGVMSDNINDFGTNLPGFIAEVVVWNLAPNSTQRGNMHSNQSTYYGTP